MNQPTLAFVTADHQPFDPEPMRAKKGERITLIRKDDGSPDFAGWWWSTTAAGKGGYVSSTFMAIDGDVVTLNRDYDATELPVMAGDALNVLEEHNGWLWAQQVNGRGEKCRGWVPKKQVLPVAELPCWQTARLQIKHLSAVKADGLLDFAERNRAHLAPTQPKLAEDYLTLAYWEKQLGKAAVEYAQDSAYRFVLLAKGQLNTVIGTVNYSQVFRGSFQACYVGYAIDGSYEGQGLMTEALMSANDHMFRARNIHRIMANYLPENAASARVLAKLGFTIEGTAKDYLHIGGRWRDHVLTSLTNHHWRSPR